MKLSNLQESIGKSIKDLVETPFNDTYVGDINFSYKNLVSLEGSPSWVDGNFDCFNTKLTSLQYAPKYVGGYFDCSTNFLTSLEYAPTVIEDSLYIDNNRSITSLIGVDDIFEEINGIFSCHAVPITEGGLGLLLIKGLKTLKTTLPALRIINKYLGKSDALYECQTELIDNRFDKIAQL